MNQYDVIPIIKELIVKEFNPDGIILFGSCAKKCVRRNSDIDICIIKDVEDKRIFRQNVINLLCDKLDFDIDLVIFSTEEWERESSDLSTFAGLIKSKGEQIYG